MSTGVLLDTHVLLWVMSDPRRLTVRAVEEVERAEHLYISSITAWEVVMLARKRRIDVGPNPGAWVRDAVALLDIIPLPLSLDVAIESDRLEDYSRQDPADRFIIATALNFRVPLVTADEVIRAWKGVETIW